MTGDTQIPPPPPPPPARARRVAEGLLPLYMSIRSKRPTGSGVRRRLLVGVCWDPCGDSFGMVLPAYQLALGGQVGFN